MRSTLLPLDTVDGDAGAPLRVGYVVKRYPRFSETFIVNEILAHEAAGTAVEIFSLHPPNDTHFQDLISRVRAPVTYLCTEGLRVADFWAELASAARECPGLWGGLRSGAEASAREVHQAAALARLVRARGITHLHAHFATTATSVARLAAGFAGIRYSFTAHAKDIFHESVDAADLRRKLVDAAGVVTVSDYNVAHLRREFGDAAEAVRRVYNGLHLDRFPFRVPGDRPPRIVAVGRLVEKKGFGDLVAAVGSLRARGVEVGCDIVGTGEQESELRGQVARLGLESWVCFHGAQPQSEVIRRVQGAAVFAAPCVVGADGNADGLPTVLLEAMALGTPCVSTTVTGIPEIVRDDDTGLLVPQRDVESLAGALERLLGDAGLRRRLAANARQVIEAHFDASRNAAELRALFAGASWRIPAATRAGSPVEAQPEGPA